jgi:hypothetical protein
MSELRNPYAGFEALLAPQDGVLLLIDHQAFQFANLHSHEPTMIVNNVAALAKDREGVPGTGHSDDSYGGARRFSDQSHSRVFPEQTPINRSFINAWADRRVVVSAR